MRIHISLYLNIESKLSQISSEKRALLLVNINFDYLNLTQTYLRDQGKSVYAH